MERVYFVCKKIRGGRTEYSIGEHGYHTPDGFHEVPRTRSTHKGLVLERKSKLQKRDSNSRTR